MREGMLPIGRVRHLLWVVLATAHFHAASGYNVFRVPRMVNNQPGPYEVGSYLFRLPRNSFAPLDENEGYEVEAPWTMAALQVPYIWPSFVPQVPMMVPATFDTVYRRQDIHLERDSGEKSPAKAKPKAPSESSNTEYSEETTQVPDKDTTLFNKDDNLDAISPSENGVSGNADPNTVNKEDKQDSLTVSKEPLIVTKNPATPFDSSYPDTTQQLPDDGESQEPTVANNIKDSNTMLSENGDNLPTVSSESEIVTKNPTAPNDSSISETKEKLSDEGEILVTTFASEIKDSEAVSNENETDSPTDSNESMTVTKSPAIPSDSSSPDITQKVPNDEGSQEPTVANDLKDSTIMPIKDDKDLPDIPSEPTIVPENPTETTQVADEGESLVSTVVSDIEETTVEPNPEEKELSTDPGKFVNTDIEDTNFDNTPIEDETVIVNQNETGQPTLENETSSSNEGTDTTPVFDGVLEPTVSEESKDSDDVWDQDSFEESDQSWRNLVGKLGGSEDNPFFHSGMFRSGLLGFPGQSMQNGTKLQKREMKNIIKKFLKKKKVPEALITESIVDTILQKVMKMNNESRALPPSSGQSSDPDKAQPGITGSKEDGSTPESLVESEESPSEGSSGQSAGDTEAENGQVKESEGSGEKAVEGEGSKLQQKNNMEEEDERSGSGDDNESRTLPPSSGQSSDPDKPPPRVTGSIEDGATLENLMESGESPTEGSPGQSSGETEAEKGQVTELEVSEGSGKTDVEAEGDKVEQKINMEEEEERSGSNGENVDPSSGDGHDPTSYENYHLKESINDPSGNMNNEWKAEADGNWKKEKTPVSENQALLSANNILKRTEEDKNQPGSVNGDLPLKGKEKLHQDDRGQIDGKMSKEQNDEHPDNDDKAGSLKEKIIETLKNKGLSLDDLESATNDLQDNVSGIESNFVQPSMIGKEQKELDGETSALSGLSLDENNSNGKQDIAEMGKMKDDTNDIAVKVNDTMLEGDNSEGVGIEPSGKGDLKNESEDIREDYGLEDTSEGPQRFGEINEGMNLEEPKIDDSKDEVDKTGAKGVARSGDMIGDSFEELDSSKHSEVDLTGAERGSLEKDETDDTKTNAGEGGSHGVIGEDEEQRKIGTEEPQGDVKKSLEKEHAENFRNLFGIGMRNGKFKDLGSDNGPGDNRVSPLDEDESKPITPETPFFPENKGKTVKELLKQKLPKGLDISSLTNVSPDVSTKKVSMKPFKFKDNDNDMEDVGVKGSFDKETNDDIGSYDILDKNYKVKTSSLNDMPKMGQGDEVEPIEETVTRVNPTFINQGGGGKLKDNDKLAKVLKKLEESMKEKPEEKVEKQVEQVENMGLTANDAGSTEETATVVNPESINADEKISLTSAKNPENPFLTVDKKKAKENENSAEKIGNLLEKLKKNKSKEVIEELEAMMKEKEKEKEQVKGETKTSEGAMGEVEGDDYPVRDSHVLISMNHNEDPLKLTAPMSWKPLVGGDFRKHKLEKHENSTN